MSSPIILYDITCKYPNHPYSPNAFKTRFILTYKGIPFKTEWLEIPEITTRYKELGIPPTSKKPDGSPHYTVPAIYDPSTNKYVSDSFLIAEYLDKQYPQTSRLIPEETVALQRAYVSAFEKNFYVASQLLVESMVKLLNPISEANVRQRFIKKPPLNKEDRKEMWAKIKGILSPIDEIVQGQGVGMFLGGDKPIFADFVVAAWIKFLEATVGKDDELWREFLTWDDGRLGQRRDMFEKWVAYD